MPCKDADQLQKYGSAAPRVHLIPISPLFSTDSWDWLCRHLSFNIATGRNRELCWAILLNTKSNVARSAAAKSAQPSVPSSPWLTASAAPTCCQGDLVGLGTKACFLLRCALWDYELPGDLYLVSDEGEWIWEESGIVEIEQIIVI